MFIHLINQNQTIIIKTKFTFLINHLSQEWTFSSINFLINWLYSSLAQLIMSQQMIWSKKLIFALTNTYIFPFLFLVKEGQNKFFTVSSEDMLARFQTLFHFVLFSWWSISPITTIFCILHISINPWSTMCNAEEYARVDEFASIKRLKQIKKVKCVEMGRLPNFQCKLCTFHSSKLV